MMVEATLRGLCNVFVTDDAESLGSILYGVTLFITLKLPNGLPVSVTHVYTYRDYDEFLRLWGHVEEYEAAAIAVKSGLIKNTSADVDITEKGVLVEDIG